MELDWIKEGSAGGNSTEARDSFAGRRSSAPSSALFPSCPSFRVRVVSRSSTVSASRLSRLGDGDGHLTRCIIHITKLKDEGHACTSQGERIAVDYELSSASCFG